MGRSASGTRNNAQEVTWGKATVAAWNTAHPSEKVSAQEIPAGKSSEEVIGAAITAGSEPCLIYNTSPASVPTFQHQGGLVALDDFPGAASYIQARTGSKATQYKSPDGKFYQMPWKSNPVMIFYNKKAFAKAGISSSQAAAGQLRRVPGDFQEAGVIGRGEVRDLPGAVERVLPVLVRLLPDVCRGERRQAAGGERQGDLRRPGWAGGCRILEANVRAKSCR